MRHLKSFLLFLVTLFAMAGAGTSAQAQAAAPMLLNYQGELRDPATGELVADGSYDMLLRIYDVQSGGSSLWEGTYTAANGNAVQVANGIFSVILGSGAGNALNTSTFNGPDRWLEIQVGDETLSPRQKITSVAYSMVSENSRLLSGRDASDFVEDGELATAISAHAAVADVHHARYTDAEAVAAMGSTTDENPLNHEKTMRLPWGSITDVPAGFADAEDNDTTYTAGAGLLLLDSQFNVSFAGSGAADTASRSDHGHDAGDIVSGMLDADRFSAYGDLATEGYLDDNAGTDLLTVEQGNGRYWSLRGNAGTNPAAIFLGTVDEQPLEVRVNNARALRLEPNATSPNVIGGQSVNRVTDGAAGATIGGGGETGLENRVSDSFGTVGGGRNNQAGDEAGTVNDKPGATVGGGAWNIASGRGATVGGGLGNQVTADWATIAGGGRVDPGNPLLGNSVFDHYGSIGGGGNNRAGSDDGDPTNATYATVAGGGTNWATGQGATIGGGFVNEASGFAATVSGGDSNTTSGDYATVAGGLGNEALGKFSTIAGGGRSDPADPLTGNRVTDDYGTIGGGARNQAGNNAGTTNDADHATVGGGYQNLAGDELTTIGGGGANTAEGYAATVAGGWNSTAQGYCATVGGGMWNEAASDLATVSGGDSNSATAEYATVGGGCMNKAAGRYATVSGGGSTDGLVYTANRVTDEYGTVAGGGNNQAGDDAGTKSDANFATVGGGHSNIAGAFSATVAGGAVNTANAAWAAIGGGNYNKVTDEYGTVAGGSGNQAGDDAGTTQDVCYATVGGGQGNTASFRWSTISGGQDNTASDLWATVDGGGWNTASGSRSSIGGGCYNTASANSATVPGGSSNTAAGEYSFASGFRAKANHNGAFVWGDSQNADVASTANDQVTFRCLGGVRFLSGSGGANQTVSWAPGSSSWSFSSDRNLKENFQPVDAEDVLEKVSRLPVAEWNFKGYPLKHIGPMAQDFHALFPLGGSDTMIDSGDLQGVALAAIQGLYEVVQEKDEEISILKKQNADLESRLAALEALVQTVLEERKGDEQ